MRADRVSFSIVLESVRKKFVAPEAFGAGQILSILAATGSNRFNGIEFRETPSERILDPLEVVVAGS